MSKGTMRGRMVLAVAVCLALSVSCLVVPARAEALRIGVLPVLDTLPLQVAAHEGLFAKHGLDVELVQFASALERDTAMQAGQIDGYFGDLIATLLLMDHGVDMRVALVTYRTQPGQPMFGIASRPGKDDCKLPGLKGSTVGISSSTIIEFLLDKVLESQNLPMDFLQRVEVKKVPIRLQMLAAGQLDLAMLPQPLYSLALFQGGCGAITTENLDLPLTVLCLGSRSFANGQAEYKAFLAAYSEAVDKLRADPEAYRMLMAETCRIPAPLVAKFPVYAYPYPALPSREDVAVVEGWMKSRKMLQADVPYERVVPAQP